ncbi:glycosyltransferase family 2 protein [Pseudomonas sp. NC26]|uniref:Glycosyltransferase family 2 protein n=1 Tax=Pseudomonas putida TaxID=303 RepID=A0A7W2L4S0_PSEPU|nr:MULTISPECIES: glycosyltransferase family 2 protein [Pseudomonas]MBA6118459.1 glycosyltransferase family 2 protein [Pseudomonas putida]MEC4875956.1 glycosyltransferase family 2 protein [Pseudomonas sp. NC26]PZQ37056.1 MAG: glycosyl transferase [Pseudomonas putida]QNL89223.1 Glycosyltransferase [Pseudomonas putida]
MDIFHRHRQAGEHELAVSVLDRAVQIAEHRPEALIWKGIAALPHNPKLAFLFLVTAAQLLPERADVRALAGRALLTQGHAELATRYLTLAWQKVPGDAALRTLLWQARSQSETPAMLRSMILAHLPEITAPKELAQVLKLLAAQAGAPAAVGVVHYLEERREIQGWAIDLGNMQAPASFKIEAGGTTVDAVANIHHPLLDAAGLSTTHGGLRIRVPNPTAAVHIRFADDTPLLGSPVFAMQSFVPPLECRTRGTQQHVDVLIPVYNGLQETLECINSALEARKRNRTPHRLVVIEDATPVPALAKALKVLAGKSKITLVNNAVNLGFIRTMNRAMAMSPDRDVVWLNADTRVHGNWLDRLRNIAHSSENIASVTPFTNNGELMSFPQSQISHVMPTAREQAELDDLTQYANIDPIEIETGCGFCLYIKRTALNQVGYLDEIHLARGYGEETDWCLRARSFGWRHMGAPNVFVAHKGGVSFGAEKTLRVAQNNAILRQRYPDASARYNAFCLRDPIKPARDALQHARLARFARQNDQDKRSQWPKEGSSTLHIHDGTGAESTPALIWRRDSHRTWVTLKAPLAPLALELDYELPEDFSELVNNLAALPLEDIVLEHQVTCPTKLCDLPSLLNIPYAIVHRDGHLQGQDATYDWQRFANEATSVLLPWQSWHRAFAEVFPQANLVTQPSAEQSAPATSEPSVLLIGDALDDPHIIQIWVRLGRRITREQLPLTLLVKQDTPWLKTLSATGAVHVLPQVNGFSLPEIAKATGCDAVVSLAPSPGARWLAPALASQFDLPLYTCRHSLGTEAGANCVTQLPFSLSQN